MEANKHKAKSEKLKAKSGERRAGSGKLIVIYSPVGAECL